MASVGFKHDDLSQPTDAFATPTYGTTTGIDYAGNNPSQIVRVGGEDDSSNPQIALSNDYGATWSANYAAPAPSSNPGYHHGTVAYSANGDTILWSNPQLGVLRSQHQGSFSVVTAIPSGAAIASDKVNGTALYASSGNNFYTSIDTGATWTSVTIPSQTYAEWIAVNPFKAGELWLSGDAGVFHSADYGMTFNALPDVSKSWKIAVGAPATTGGTPSLYVSAVVGGVNGVYRTDDQVNWVKLSDSTHGFGASSSVVLAADTRIYKRVYIGTNGR